MKHLHIYIFSALLGLFFIHIIFRIFVYLPEYQTPFDADYWEDRYNTSQWVISESKNPIGDDGLYAFVGWKYIQGIDPTLLNAEIPPLPKYIIGVGELVFGNQNIMMLVIGLMCLGIFYLLNLKIFSSRFLAFIPVFIFSFDPLFFSQYRAPYLDTIYLLFLLLSLYFTLQRKYIFAAVFIGCFASTKFPIGSVFLVAPISLWVYIYDKRNIKKFIASLIIWPIVFIFSYGMYFYHGGGILGFLGVQKWIINFYATGVKSFPGIVYPIITTGTWHTWFQGAQRVVEWTIVWPISVVLSMLAGILILKDFHRRYKDNVQISLIFFWAVFYLLFLTITPVFPRYLLLLLPFMYNLSVWFLITSHSRK